MDVRIAVVSTFPPTQCGIATFAQSLVTHLGTPGRDVGVLRVSDEPGPTRLPVVHRWMPDSRGSAVAAAAVLDTYDVVLVQHEYGIFGDDDGQAILDLLERTRVPVVTVLHTVLANPTPNQRRILAELCERSDALVTMTVMAHDRLIAGWDVDPRTVHVIPHGADVVRPHAHAVKQHDDRQVVLTWGLLSEGKGIEWALRALARLEGSVELPLYRIVGRTHPRVVEREGEAYRERLVALVHELGLTGTVEFDDRYLTREQLASAVDDADLVLLPYDSLEQVTSGVLTEAVAAGKPVISTAFPHAVELLSGGAGIVVPHADHVAIADALALLLQDGGRTEQMAGTARGLSRGLHWSSIAARYVELARSVSRVPLGTAI